MTPNMMLTRDNDAIPHCYRNMTQALMRIQNEGLLARFADRLTQIGKSHAVPVADVYGVWSRMAARGDDVTAMLSNGLNHPNAEGHRLAARALMEIVNLPSV